MKLTLLFFFYYYKGKGLLMLAARFLASEREPYLRFPREAKGLDFTYDQISGQP